ncbi:MAG: 7TM-DISM domain-containing protein, partial [Spirochaetales bacterium]|nr:7TM-DISM domain-containing protein [Spirochaetales bacterium]
MIYKPLLYEKNSTAYHLMKKNISLCILTFLLLTGFIIVHLSSCSIQENKSTQFTVKNGYIDLRQWNHRSTPILDLNGEWKFKWMDTDSSYADENYDDTSWEVFNVPGVWNSPARQGKGYGWFRAKVRVDPHINLGLYLQYSNMSYVLYINGKEAIRNGEPGESRETTIPETIPKFTRLPKADTHVIAWKISNFHDIQGGPFHPLKIGNIENIEHMFFINNFKNIFILGVTFIFIIFYVIRWKMRPQDRASLFFALFCFMIFLRTLSTSHLLEQLLLPFAIPTMEICTWSRKIGYGSVPLIWTFFLLFLRDIFSKDISAKIPKNDSKDGFTYISRVINKIFLITFVSSGILLFAFTLLTPIEVFTNFLVVYETLAFLAGIYSLVILIYAIINKNKYALITACGFIIFFLFIINDILFTSSMIYTGDLLPIGLVILLIFQSTVLSMRSAQAFSKAEYLSEHLSKEVHKRTLELESANSKIKKQAQERILIFIKLAHEIKNPL